MEADTNADPLIARCATPRWYITSRKAQSYALTHAPKLQLPLLLLLGTADGVANPDTMRSFFSSAGSKDKTKLEYPGLHHELLREVERNTIYHDISDWILSHSQHPAPYTPST
jgi:alpha-beta hydrolase superfamily lysophospholipase